MSGFGDGLDIFYTPIIDPGLLDMSQQSLDHTASPAYHEAHRRAQHDDSLQYGRTGSARNFTGSQEHASDYDSLFDSAEEGDQTFMEVEGDGTDYSHPTENAWNSISPQDKELLQHHLTMRVTTGHGDTARTMKITSYLQQDLTVDQVDEVIRVVRYNAMFALYTCNVHDELATLEHIYAIAEYLIKTGRPDLGRKFLLVLDILSYGGILRSTCRFLPEALITATLRDSQQLQMVIASLPSPIQQAVSAARYNIRQFELQEDDSEESEQGSAPLSTLSRKNFIALKRQLWQHILNRNNKPSSHAVLVNVKGCLSSRLCLPIKMVVLALAKTAMPDEEFDLQGSDSLAHMAEELEDQWQRDKVHGTVELPHLDLNPLSASSVANLTSSPKTFNDRSDAHHGFYGDNRKLNIAHDDVEIVIRHKSYFTQELYKAICSLPVIADGELSDKDRLKVGYIKELHKMIEKRGGEGAAREKLSGLAALLCEQVIQLHTEGDTLTQPSECKKFDLTFTATERIQELLNNVAEVKFYVHKCFKDHDKGIAEIVAFPRTFYERCFRNSDRNRRQREETQELRAMAAATASTSSSSQELGERVEEDDEAFEMTVISTSQDMSAQLRTPPRPIANNAGQSTPHTPINATTNHQANSWASVNFSFNNDNTNFPTSHQATPMTPSPSSAGNFTPGTLRSGSSAQGRRDAKWRRRNANF